MISDVEDLIVLFKKLYFIIEGKNVNFKYRGTANISEILYAKLYFHLKKPKTCTLRIWLFC